MTDRACVVPGSLLRAVALSLAVGLSACDSLQDPVSSEAGVVPSYSMAESEFGVYTQNLYLGGDTGPLFTIDLTDFEAVRDATVTFWTQVQSSAVLERMSAVLDEIDALRPDVVGLQEALQFGVVDVTTTPPTVVGGIDLLATLQYLIALRGLPYTVDVVQASTSATLPLAGTSFQDISTVLAFTDRIAALRRNDVELVGTASAQYQAYLQLGDIQFRRGWARLSVMHDGTVHNFVTTHLETQIAAPIQALQVQELLGVVDNLQGVTVVAGDLNSDAAAGPGVPSWTPTYNTLLENGFSDVWTLSSSSRHETGLTCCQEPTLSNTTSELSQRLDLVLVRTSSQDATESDRLPGAFWADVVGNQPLQLSATVFWPADHAGLSASFITPTGLR